MSNFMTSGDLPSSEVTNRIRAMAEQLAKIHGPVLISREAKGIHLYMASPQCLELEGERELDKRHLAVNASKYLGTEQWAGRSVEFRDECAMCMKSKKTYRVSELLSMPPLAERGIELRKKGSDVVVGALTRVLVPDGKGNMIPPPPGELIPIHQCPADNPGRWYLESRGYDLEALYHQFGASWCYAELPESERLKVFYRRMPLGFRSTPQGRVIFFASIFGANKTWQGRIPEIKDGPHKYYWHPYENRWVLCEYWEPSIGKFVPTPEIRASPRKWEMPKYRTAAHTLRMEILMGFDSAVAWAQQAGSSTCFLVEGPLDAGRLGVPTCAIIGDKFSDVQATLLLSNFRRIVYFPDTGKAGQDCAEAIKLRLTGQCDLHIETLPPGVSDPGELSRSQVAFYRQKYLAV